MKKILIMMLQLFVLIVTCYATLVNAGEWNEKPVICASKEETFGVINEKNETLIFTGSEFAKVRSETGLAKKPATLPFSFYINLQTGTYTIIEYHAEYETYCVIAYGTNLQTFGSSPL